jgi:hypothetical protein
LLDAEIKSAAMTMQCIALLLLALISIGCSSTPANKDAAVIQAYVQQQKLCEEAASRKHKIKMVMPNIGAVEVPMQIPIDREAFEYCMQAAGYNRGPVVEIEE